MAHPERQRIGELSDVIAQVAAPTVPGVKDYTYEAGQHIEIIKQQLQDRYRSEVFTPRLEFWTTFNDHLKAAEPSWVNPLILEPKKPEGLANTNKANVYYSRLEVARWQFENTLPAEQVRTETTVCGFEVAGDYGGRSLANDLPKTNMLTFLLGRNQTIRDAYLTSRIQAINAYTIQTNIRNLQTGESQDIWFGGQHRFDTMVTVEQLRAARRTYTKDQKEEGGISFQSRSQLFEGTFSAPIEVPVELSERFIPKRQPGGGIDVGGTYQDYDYLFQSTPCALFYGQLDVSNGKDLFKSGGNETLAYMQAQALFAHIVNSSQVRPALAPGKPTSEL